MLRKPRPLTKASHVAVLAASSPSELPRIAHAAKNLRARGLRVTLAPNIAVRDRYLAAGDDERVGVLNEFLRSPEFDGFFFARGGYGLHRILDRVDYDAVAANPRPIIGFSDLTALHQAAAVRAGVATFHGPMMNTDWHDGLSPDREAWFWSMLAGDAPLTWSFNADQVLNPGAAEGVLFGGCVSLTNDLTGTPYDFWIDDGIWFWEDVDEPVYRIDRMLTHLRLTGRLKKIRGVIIGSLRGCGSDAEITVFLREFFGSMSIPVVRHFPFGHDGDNLLMPIGIRARLSTIDNVLAITEPAVALG